MITAQEAQALALRAAVEWPAIGGVPELIMHRENTVFRVASAQGPFALRMHRQGYHSEAALRSELQVMAMLAKGGMRVPVPLAARSSDMLVAVPTPDGARMFSLLSWLPGVPLGRTGQQLTLGPDARVQVFRALGQGMARMHGLADGWLPPEGFTRPSLDAEGLVGARPVWGRFWDSATGDEDAARLTRARHAIAEWLAARPSGGGDFGLIHADLVRENVLVDGADVSFIDFDDCGFGFRLFDIATALLKNIDEPDFAALHEAVIAGYSSLRALPDGAKDDLPWFMAIRALTYLGWANDRPDEPGMPARRARFHATALRMLQAVGL